MCLTSVGFLRAVPLEQLFPLSLLSVSLDCDFTDCSLIPHTAWCRAVKYPDGCWGLNSGLPEEQCALSAASFLCRIYSGDWSQGLILSEQAFYH